MVRRPALPRGLGLLGRGGLPRRPAEPARCRSPSCSCVVEGAGLVVVLAIIAATGEPLPGTRAAILSRRSPAIGGVIALGCFYRALAIGTMSIVAPISATGVALPVVVGIATGDRLSTVVAVGLAVAVVGVAAGLARAARRRRAARPPAS